MRISTKLIIAFNIVAAIPLVGGAIGLLSYRSAVEREARTTSELQATLETTDVARQAQLGFKTQVQEWKNVLLRSADAAAHAKHRNGLNTQEVTLRSKLEGLRGDARLSPEHAALVSGVLEAHAALGQRYRELLEKFVPGETGAAGELDRGINGMDRAVFDRLDALAAALGERAGAAVAHAKARREAESTTRQVVMLVGTILGISLGVIFGITLSLGVSRYIRDVATRLHSGTEQVASASAQVSGASQELASASSRQAASLEETSASLEEISGTIRHNAENARTAQELSNQNRHAADAGAGEMATMQTAMNEISEASANIAKIVKSIDEIAFQTNILALNAAVEAARAGEAGAGFAVVAEEVRNLAQRSAQAAKETANKIADAIQKSENGARISERIAATLTRILGNAHQIDVLIAEIATASQEQAKGIESVNQSMVQMDQLTQGNATSAEETASSAKELDALALRLQEEIALLLDRRSEAAAPDAPSQTNEEASEKTGRLLSTR